MSIREIGRLLKLAPLLLLVGWSLSAQAQVSGLSVEPVETWTNVFASAEADTFREVDVHFLVKSPYEWRGRLAWSVSIAKATVERRETAVSAAPNKPAQVKIKLRVPFVRAGLVTEGKLTVTLTRDGNNEIAARYAKPLRIYPHQAFVQRERWLKDLKIALYDPRDTTADPFKKSGIPFTAISNPAELAGRSGLVVIGEGVSFEEERGLPEVLLKAAQGGLPVLCLAPTNGHVPLPHTGAPEALLFKDAKVITSLDKNLDDRGWLPDGKVRVGGFTLQAVGGLVAGEVTEGGWPWLEIQYSNGGRLIVCGFGIMSHWEAGPTPRFLLARILEHMTTKADSSNED